MIIPPSKKKKIGSRLVIRLVELALQFWLDIFVQSCANAVTVIGILNVNSFGSICQYILCFTFKRRVWQRDRQMDGQTCPHLVLGSKLTSTPMVSGSLALLWLYDQMFCFQFIFSYKYQSYLHTAEIVDYDQKLIALQENVYTISTCNLSKVIWLLEIEKKSKLKDFDWFQRALTTPRRNCGIGRKRFRVLSASVTTPTLSLSTW